jgi:hypothetical protein
MQDTLLAPLINSSNGLQVLLLLLPGLLAALVAAAGHHLVQLLLMQQQQQDVAAGGLPRMQRCTQMRSFSQLLVELHQHLGCHQQGVQGQVMTLRLGRVQRSRCLLGLTAAAAVLRLGEVQLEVLQLLGMCTAWVMTAEVTLHSSCSGNSSSLSLSCSSSSSSSARVGSMGSMQWTLARSMTVLLGGTGDPAAAAAQQQLQDHMDHTVSSITWSARSASAAVLLVALMCCTVAPA